VVQGVLGQLMRLRSMQDVSSVVSVRMQSTHSVSLSSLPFESSESDSGSFSLDS
jgi:hypothetical protein